MQYFRWHLTRLEQGQNDLPWPVGHASLDVAQDKFAFWAANAHFQLMTNFLFPSLYPQGCSQSILCLTRTCAWVAPAHVPDPALGLTELHEICMSPPLKTVTVLLGGIPSLQRVSYTAQLAAQLSLADLLGVNSIPLSLSPTKVPKEVCCALPT